MPRWEHTITFETGEGRTSIEWYLDEMPKYIEMYKDNPDYVVQVAVAQSKLNLIEELGLSINGKPNISRPIEELEITKYQECCHE